MKKEIDDDYKYYSEEKYFSESDSDENSGGEKKLSIK